jgi:periplasmic divalent cation tolerance protein
MDPSNRSQADERDIATSGGEAVLVLITTATRDEADRIARGLVEQRLAACVTIVPQARSFFWWENKLSEEEEVLLLMKTRRSHLRQLIVRVKALHSYSVPEIIALPIVEGSTSYLEWVDEATRK